MGALERVQFENKGSQLLLAAFSKMIAPLIRLLLRNRIGFHSCVKVVKNVYVEIANTEEEFFPRARATQTNSNITLLTGIRRGDVKAILMESGRTDLSVRPLPESLLLQAWKQDPIFCVDGKPRILPIGGKGSTFATLVSRHGGGATYGPIMDSLVSAGCVEVLPAAKVKLIKSTYTPSLDDPDRINVASISSVRLANTLLNNLDGTNPTVYQKEIWSVSCPQSRVAEFTETSKALLDGFYDDTDTFLQEGYEEQPAINTHASVGVGFYAFVEGRPNG